MMYIGDNLNAYVGNIVKGYMITRKTGEAPGDVAYYGRPATACELEIARARSMSWRAWSDAFAAKAAPFSVLQGRYVVEF